MKTFLKRLLIAAALLAMISALASCGAPAPYGTFAPSDAEKYKTGVEEAIFAVPESYTVTMSSNMLAATDGKSSFSLQCRHSDYALYGSLKKNYDELKKQLVGFWGDYGETLFNEDAEMAGQNALEVRYDLTVAGEDCSFVQYLFYAPKTSALEGKRFLLFTYACPAGQTDEALLEQVAKSVSVKKEGYTAPAGFKAVENAAASALLSDRYELYCPDEWVFDTSLGQVTMRVPSAKILSNISFSEIGTGDFQEYAEAYAIQNAAALDRSSLSGLDLYIVAAVYRMKEAYPDLELSLVGDASEKSQPSADELSSRASDYLQSVETSKGLTFRYIDFQTSLPDYDAHGKNVNDRDMRVDDPEVNDVVYHVRQYFIYRGGYLYLFTYTATKEGFDAQFNDAFKVISNFAFK